MADNLFSTIHGTAADSVNGLTAVERFLFTKYLTEREFETVLANNRWGSKNSIPRRVADHVRFTRRKKLRLPEVGTEGADPQSGATLAYEQLEAPIEFVKEFVAIGTEVESLTWLNLAQDARELMNEALRRIMHRRAQGAFLMGRVKPGKRNSSGVTDGSSDFPNFFEEEESSFTKRGVTYVFPAAPSFFVSGKDAFTELDAQDRHKMIDYESARVRLSNSGAPKINGKYVAIISDAVKDDLMRDDQFFAASIRNMRASDMLFEGNISTYKGIIWMEDDEPWTLQIGGDGLKFVQSEKVHVSQMFGKDAFGYLRLGGKNAASGASFKAQDISKTGSLMTIGYSVPYQVRILNESWCVNIIGPVSTAEAVTTITP